MPFGLNSAPELFCPEKNGEKGNLILYYLLLPDHIRDESYTCIHFHSLCAPLTSNIILMMTTNMPSCLNNAPEFFQPEKLEEKSNYILYNLFVWQYQNLYTQN